MAKHQHHTEEKLMTFYYKSVDFFQKNKKHVYTALTILVIVIAGIVLLVNKRKANNELAAIELEKVRMLYSSNDFNKAINGDSLGAKGLQFIVDEYGSTDNGETAKIMLANCYYALRDFDKAEKYYKDFSGHNNLLKVAASAGIAAVYEARNNYSEAAKQFEKTASISKDNPFNDEYVFYAVKDYYRANDLENKKKLLTRLKEDYPKSKYLAEAEKYKSVIN